MVKKRVIAIIIISEGKVVQSEKFNHNHVIHYDAVHAVEAFSRWDVDEIVMLNVSKLPSTAKEFLAIVERVSNKCWVPLSVGGHIDNEGYAADLLSSGADKLVFNTAFHRRRSLPLNISHRFGRQCVIASIDIRANQSNGKKTVHIDRGQVDTGLGLVSSLELVESCGAGEILLNNIDFDGNRGGYDLESLRLAVNSTDLPIIIFGGANSNKHFAEGLDNGAAAVAAANMFHYKEMATKQVKRYLLAHNYYVRSQN